MTSARAWRRAARARKPPWLDPAAYRSRLDRVGAGQPLTALLDPAAQQGNRFALMPLANATEAIDTPGREQAATRFALNSSPLHRLDSVHVSAKKNKWSSEHDAPRPAGRNQDELAGRLRCSTFQRRFGRSKNMGFNTWFGDPWLAWLGGIEPSVDSKGDSYCPRRSRTGPPRRSNREPALVLSASSALPIGANARAVNLARHDVRPPSGLRSVGE
ncbi:hypothetical protein J2X90_005972 [Variovorax paradoxus]|nr:hypothetical protein [Variovorax paradoxus]